LHWRRPATHGTTNIDHANHGAPTQDKDLSYSFSDPLSVVVVVVVAKEFEISSFVFLMLIL
jgi:hypothetical protein